MFFKVKEYFFYIIRCFHRNTLNSSFIEQFRCSVLDQKVEISEVDKLRNYYKTSDTKIKIEDYGAGSKTLKKESHLNTRDLYHKVAIAKKYGEILFKLVSFLEVKNILELGTSLGISAAYMHQANVSTVEGNQDLAENTAKVLKEHQFDSINVLKAKFDDILPNLLKNNDFELVFIDGNHTEKATIEYFNILRNFSSTKLVIIFDDIYWSKGMKSAWQSIKKHKEVNLSIDLFKFGIVFIRDKKLEKEDITLWY